LEAFNLKPKYKPLKKSYLFKLQIKPLYSEGYINNRLYFFKAIKIILLEINLKAFLPTQSLPDINNNKEEEIQIIKEQLREPSIKASNTIKSEGEEADKIHNNSEALSKPSNKRQRIYINNSNNYYPENYSLSRAGRIRKASAKVRNS
ncbi:unnamed protein product, partial [Clonostachys rhizophaga]